MNIHAARMKYISRVLFLSRISVISLCFEKENIYYCVSFYSECDEVCNDMVREKVEEGSGYDETQA